MHKTLGSILKKESGLESIGLIFNLNPRIGGDRISSEPRKPTPRAGLEGSQGEAGAGPGCSDRAGLRECAPEGKRADQEAARGEGYRVEGRWPQCF